MRINAVSCVAFGALFLAVPRAISAFLGDVPWPVLGVIGLGLIANGGHLLITAARPDVRSLRYFALGDALWVAGSAILLATGVWITTPYGRIATVAVALMVGLFGWLQWRAVRFAFRNA